jgi:hypothetical protein
MNSHSCVVLHFPEFFTAERSLWKIFYCIRILVPLTKAFAMHSSASFPEDGRIGPVRTKVLWRFCLYFVMLWVQSIFAQLPDLQFTVSVPSVITHITPADFDIVNSGKIYPVFTLAVSNLGNPDSARNCRLRYTIHLRLSPVSATGVSERIYEARSNRFSLSPGEMATVTSVDYFNATPGAKMYHSTTDFELSDSELRQRFIETQRVPDGQIIQEMVLYTDDGGGRVIDRSGPVYHTILNATTIMLLSPGSDAFNDLPIISDPNPLFTWTSDLPPHIYGQSPVYELSIYEARSGQSGIEAVNTTPILSLTTSEPVIRFPRTTRRLISGKHYFWRVKGYLKGFTASALTSNVYGFIFEESINPEVLEALRILRLICSESDLKPVESYRKDVSIHIKSDAKGIAELRAEVGKIVSGQNALIGVTVK